MPGKFKRVTFTHEEIRAAALTVKEAFNLSMQEAMERVIKNIEESETWANGAYQVAIRRGIKAKGFPELIHLSIKRFDKASIHDWREMQKIKNELVGAEHEAVELYPAESRLVDTANQYHLWVLADESVRFPFGLGDERFTIDKSIGNSRQRPQGG